MVEGFDTVEVCCETVVACVEPEVCDCVVSGFVFLLFSHVDTISIAVYTTHLNYLQKVHIPELVQTSKNVGSKSSSVTSLVTTDLRHTPQNF
jgi:hypothetical protein